MDLDTRGVPYRKNNDAEIIVDTRPLIIEEWLETLPYADFKKTCSLLISAISDTNQQKMKYLQRLELATMYHQPYQFLLESQLGSRPNLTQNAILSLQSNLSHLKELSLLMATACRMAVEDALNHKTMWISSKPPIDAILMAINYFSESLVCCYLQYHPTPKSLWKDMHFLYAFSENLNKHNFLVNEFGIEDSDKRTTVANAYKRIVLTSLVNPYHMPFGAIWEIYLAMNDWAGMTEIIAYKDIDDSSSVMVMDLTHDIRPVPYSKFNKKMAKNREMRMLYVGTLVKMLQTKLKSLSNNSTDTVSIPFASHYLEYVLKNMVADLEAPEKRSNVRQHKNMMVRVAQGFNDSYYYINDEQEFVAKDLIDEDDVGAMLEITGTNFNAEHAIGIWELQDYSQGGYALRKEFKADSVVRVGELLAIYTGKVGVYNLGVISWLMVRAGNMYNVGIEVIAREVNAARIRKRNSQSDYSRAFVSGDSENGSAVLVLEQSVGDVDGMYELNIAGQISTIRLQSLIIQTVSVCQFAYQLLDV